MFIKNKKRGFTIVELVIVIAVIAVLSAILIPTFVSLIEKSKRTADERAVAQLNEVVMVEEATTNLKKNELGIFNVVAVYDAVRSHSLVPDYDPLSNGLETCYDNVSNRFLLYKTEDGNVVFPRAFTTHKVSGVQNAYTPESGAGYYKLKEETDEPISDGEYTYNLKTDVLEKSGAAFSGVNPSNIGEHGLYYNEGKLFTGTVSGVETGTGNRDISYENGMLVADSTFDESSGLAVNFSAEGVPQEYLTKKIKIDAAGGNFNGFMNEVFDADYYMPTSIQSKVSVSAGENYELSEISATSELLGFITTLEKLISQSKGQAQSYIRDNFYNYETDTKGEFYKYIPNITYGDSFIAYMGEMWGISKFTKATYDDYRKLYAAKYNADFAKSEGLDQKNLKTSTGKPFRTFTNYLTDMDDADLLDLKWNEVVAIKFGSSFTWADPDFARSKPSQYYGLLQGNAASKEDGSDGDLFYKAFEPEFVLAYWKVLYGKTLVVGITNEKMPYTAGSLYKDSRAIGDNSDMTTKKFYSEFGSDWIERVEEAYKKSDSNPNGADGLVLRSWLDITRINEDGTRGFDLSSLTNKSGEITFYLFTCIHGYLYGNGLQSGELWPVNFNIILENKNFE